MDIIQQQLDKKKTYTSPVQKLLESTGQQSAGEFSLQTGKTGFSGFATGFGKEEINTASNMSSAGQSMLNAPLKGVNWLSNKLGGGDVFNQRFMNTGAKDMIPQELRTPQSQAEKAGFVTAQVAEFLIPGTLSTKAGKAAQAAVKGGKVLGATARLGATGLTEGILGTGQASLQSGELGRKEAQIGAVSLVAPAVIEGFGKVASKLIPTSVKTKLVNSINKAIKPSTKSIKTPGYNDAAIKAFKVMDDNPTAFDGVVRNPKTVSETLETLKNAKQSIFSRYDDIAQQSGEMGAKFPVQQTQADLSNWIKSKGFSPEIKQYASKRLQELSDLDGASPKLVQDRIQELNSGIKFFTSGSEKMKNQIDASIANRLRTQLDDIIFNTTGQPYQQIKNQYQVLKTVEDDISRTAANLARRGENGLLDFTDIFTGSDIVSGVLTGNPSAIVGGSFGRATKEYMKYLNSPDKHIEDIFKLIKKVPSAKSSRIPTQKLLNPGTPGKVINNSPINLPAKAQSTLDAADLQRVNISKNMVEQLDNAQKDAARLLKEAQESMTESAWKAYTKAQTLVDDLTALGNKADTSVWSKLKNNQSGFAKIPGVKNPMKAQLEESWQKIHDNAVRRGMLEKPAIKKALKQIEDKLKNL